MWIDGGECPAAIGRISSIHGLYILDRYWEEAGQIIHVHDVVSAEPVSGASQHFGRREGEGDIARR